jgi:uncharacterized protein
MQNEEQQLIDNLFERLKQAGTETAARDKDAEQLIQQHIQSQPGAPYYMAQALIVQEAALTKLNARVNELEQQLATQTKPTSGSFLAGLFGGGNNSSKSQAIPGQANYRTAQEPPQNQQNYTQQNASSTARSSGFLGGALQTAAGVAGGVVLGNMLTGLFSHSHPEEIVNIINEPPLDTPNYDENLDVFNNGEAGNHSQFESQDYADNQDSSGLFGDDGGFDEDDGFF